MKKIKRKWKKRYLAGGLLLALAAAATCNYLPALYAANKIDLTEPCSLTLQVADTGAYAEDLKEITLNAELYRVASVDVNGKYTATEGFESLEIDKLTKGEGDWEQTAAEAEELAEESSADAELQIVNGTGTAEELKAGMYLVLVEKGTTELYEYSFQPYFIALPDNPYYHSGQPGEDNWQYDVTGTLKPEQNPRYGSLRIRKNLSAFNTSLKDVTFVFQVEGVDGEGNPVYSNVVSTTHSAAGEKEAVIENIPAGTVVTVTEVYSGASYRLETAPEQTATILAEDVVGVEFSNTYDDELTPGYGVTNHFDYDEDAGWQWSERKDNSTVQE